MHGVSSEWDMAQAAAGTWDRQDKQVPSQGKGTGWHFYQAPFPVVESVGKIPKIRWSFDWSITLRQTPALSAGVRHVSAGSCCPCSPNTSARHPTHPAETRTRHECCQNYTEHPSPWGHTARAPRRAWTPHQQHFPAWSCKITNKSFPGQHRHRQRAQNQPLHDSKCHTWQSRSDL